MFKFIESIIDTIDLRAKYPENDEFLITEQRALLGQ